MNREGAAFAVILAVAVLADGVLTALPLWLGAGVLFGLIGLAGWLVCGPHERRWKT